MRTGKAVHVLGLAAFAMQLGMSRAAADSPPRERSYGRHDWAAEQVSILSLIVSPERWFERRVQVAGLIFVDEESSFLCFSREIIPLLAVANCIDLELDFEALKIARSDLEGLSGQGALVEGLFQTPEAKPESSTIAHDGGSARVVEVPTRSISGRLASVSRVLVPSAEPEASPESPKAEGDLPP